MHSKNKILSIVIIFVLSAVLINCSSENKAENTEKIIGWNILSSDKSNALKVINSAKEYNVNHLQLSHNIIHDLREIKEPGKQKLVNELIDKAHQNDIPEVVVWDHALYDLEYYPSEFKTAKDGKIDLDTPAFWEWLKDDYRRMLKLMPDVDGIVLTFIETGARIEEQYSEKLVSPEQKLAALVDTIASVVINENNLKLYIRDFSYNRNELSSLLKCFDLIQNPEIIVMSKEVPHDFFITHPVSWWIEKIKFPVMIEFDCTHEFNGQSVVASIFPEVHFNRMEYYKSLPNVIGFSIRTDRYGTTTIIDRPSEINLFALHKLMQQPDIDMESIYDDFITKHYGVKVLKPVKEIFKKAPDIITSVYYTLGLNTAKHSSLNFDYRSIYTRHVSGRWLDNPTIVINHGVNKEFHYWIDVVNHLAPAEYKAYSEKNSEEIGDVIENKWIQPKELMNEEYLSYVLTEKNYGEKLAQEVLTELSSLKNDFEYPDAYTNLYNTFERIEISSRLFSAMAKTYYGYRIYNRGKSFRTEKVINTIKNGLNELKTAAEKINAYDKDYPVGQYDWKNDADLAMKFYKAVSSHNYEF